VRAYRFFIIIFFLLIHNIFEHGPGVCIITISFSSPLWSRAGLLRTIRSFRLMCVPTQYILIRVSCARDRLTNNFCIADRWNCRERYRDTNEIRNNSRSHRPRSYPARDSDRSKLLLLLFRLRIAIKIRKTGSPRNEKSDEKQSWSLKRYENRIFTNLYVVPVLYYRWAAF